MPRSLPSSTATSRSRCSGRAGAASSVRHAPLIPSSTASRPPWGTAALTPSRAFRSHVSAPGLPANRRAGNTMGSPEEPGIRRERPVLGIANRYLSKYALLMALVALVVFFSAIRPDTFGTVSNLEAIATAETPVIILAFAEMVVLIIGRIDLSIGATFSLSTVTASDLILKHQVTPVVGIGVALFAAAAIGLVNGLLVALGRIDAFVVTLATWTVVNGLVLLFTNGVSIYGRTSGVFGSLTTGSVLGVPLLLVYAVAGTVLLAALLSSFPVG